MNINTNFKLVTSIWKLQSEQYQTFVNMLIGSLCPKCYHRNRRPTRKAQKCTQEKIKVYYCLDGRKSFGKNSEPNFKP